MIIQINSMITGKVNEMDLPITMQQLEAWLIRKGLIQNIMPNLTPMQREFLITGMSEEEQNDFYSQLKEEDED
jgi:hypothetical protein